MYRDLQGFAGFREVQRFEADIEFRICWEHLSYGKQRDLGICHVWGEG